MSGKKRTDKSAAKRITKSDRKRVSRGTSGDSSAASQRGVRPRGLAAEMLSEREARRFIREVRAATANGIRVSQVAKALGYTNPSSFSTALKRVRIPRDVAEKFAALVGASATTAETPSETSGNTKPQRRRGSKSPRRDSRKTIEQRSSGASQRREAGSGEPAQKPSRPEPRNSMVGDEGSSPATATAISTERAVPLPTVSGPADVERRQRFVEQVNEASEYLLQAHDSLQATIRSGAATVVTTPGVQRIMEMLQHLREELAAT